MRMTFGDSIIIEWVLHPIMSAMAMEKMDLTTTNEHVHIAVKTAQYFLLFIAATVWTNLKVKSLQLSQCQI